MQRNGQPLVGGIYVFDAQLVAYTDGHGGLRLRELGRELYQTSIPHNGYQSPPIMERRDGLRFAQNQSLERRARLGLECEKQVPERRYRVALDGPGRQDRQKSGQQWGKMARVYEGIAEGPIECQKTE